MIVFAWWVIASAIWHGVYGTLPHPDVMGLVASAALLANGSVALLLYGFLSSFSDGNELGALPPKDNESASTRALPRDARQREVLRNRLGE